MALSVSREPVSCCSFECVCYSVPLLQIFFRSPQNRLQQFQLQMDVLHKGRSEKLTDERKENISRAVRIFAKTTAELHRTDVSIWIRTLLKSDSLLYVFQRLTEYEQSKIYLHFQKRLDCYCDSDFCNSSSIVSVVLTLLSAVFYIALSI